MDWFILDGFDKIQRLIIKLKKMSKSGKIILGLIVIVLIILGVKYYGNVQKSADVVIEGTGPIKIGFIGPLTGEAAVYGLPRQNQVKMALNEINAAAESTE